MTIHRTGKLLGLLPFIILVLWLVAYGSSEYPYGDTYTFSARTAIATVDGTLSVDHFLQISNGHRILFSRLVTAFLTITTHWDTRLEVVVNVSLACANVLLAVALIKKFAPSVVPLAWFPMSLLLLSVDQMINWVSGVQSLWHFVLFCLLANLNLLVGKNRRVWKMGMVLFLSLFATFSAGNGMVIWACVIGAMLLLRYDERLIGVIFIIGTLAVLGYLHNSGIGMKDQSNVVLYGEIRVVHPKEIAELVLIFIGRPLADRIEIAPFIGLGGIILLYYALLTRQRGVWIWATVAGYSLLSALQIALTRVHHFDVEVGFAERYFSISITFWVALCGMWFVRLSNQPNRDGVGTRLIHTTSLPHTKKIRLLSFLIILLICATHLIALSFQAGRTDWNNPVNHAMLEGECIRRYPITREGVCNGWIVPDGTITDQLVERRLSGFARSTFLPKRDS